jgi:hypothetical protein
MNKLLLLILTGCYLAEQASAQSGVTGIGTTTPHASAVLDINSNNKGVLFPRISTTQRMAIVSPAMGLMVYDSDKRTIFLYDGAQWLPMLSAATNFNIPPQSIVPSELEEGNYFGQSVAIAGDYAIVGCPNPSGIGRAYVYFRNSGVWMQQTVLTAADATQNDEFGTAVAINGNYAIVGAPKDDILSSTPPILSLENRGSIYIFVRSGSTWTQQAKMISTVAQSNQNYGSSLSLEGDRLVVGAERDTDAGAAYIYQRNGNLWIFQQRLIASDGAADDRFGYRVDITNNYIIVGASNANPSGAAYIFFFNGTTWTQQQKLPSAGTDAQAKGRAVFINDTMALVGSPLYSSGGVFFNGVVGSYRRTGTTWVSMTSIHAPDGVDQANFGTSISFYGGYAIIGAQQGAGPYPGNGTAYIYKFVGLSWQFQQKINDPTLLPDSFGYAVAIDGFNLIIGSPTKANGKGGVAFLNIQ